MDWFGAGFDGPLIAIRAIHFAATAVTTGTLVFRSAVAKPALGSEDAVARLFRAQNLRVAWIGLAVTVVSGVIWLLLQAGSMSGLPLGEAMTTDVLLTVLNQTQFGSVSEIRLLLATILAICLAYDRLALADRLAAELDYVEVLHRERKEGLGPAYLAGFRRALAEGADG